MLISYHHVDYGEMEGCRTGNVKGMSGLDCLFDDIICVFER